MSKWQAIPFMVIARSPLAIGERKPGGQFRESWPYIPGSLVRGAVAEILLRGAKDDHDCNGYHQDNPEQREGCLFYRTFLGKAPALFGNAYPAPYDGEYPAPGDGMPRVIPATAVTCKDRSGFARHSRSGCRLADEPEPHGVFDTLIDRLCCEELEPAGMLYRPSCPRYDPANPQCSGRVDKFTGFYVARKGRSLYQWLKEGCQAEGLFKFEKTSVPQRILTRVALNRRRGVAEEGLLYSPFVLTEGERITGEKGVESQPSRFVGLIWAPKDLAEVVRDALEKVDYIGGSASRGLGRVEVRITERFASSTVEERLEAFNQVLRKRWELYKRLGGGTEHSHDKGYFFVIGLQSDAILKREGWLPTMVLNEEMLQEAAGVRDASLKLIRSYATYGYRGGWQSAWGLPKEVEVTARMGSCYVFWTQDIGLWEPALARLEITGIGERRAEGFGRVRVCDEFHLILKEVAR